MLPELQRRVHSHLQNRNLQQSTDIPKAPELQLFVKSRTGRSDLAHWTRHTVIHRQPEMSIFTPPPAWSKRPLYSQNRLPPKETGTTGSGRAPLIPANRAPISFYGFCGTFSSSSKKSPSSSRPFKIALIAGDLCGESSSSGKAFSRVWVVRTDGVRKSPKGSEVRKS